MYWSPEQQRALKEMLEQKQAAGTISPQEIQTLERVSEEGDTISRLFPTLTKTHNIFDVMNVDQMSLFWILMLYMAKHGQGAAVKEIILKMFTGTFDALKSYMVRAGSNRITAWGGGRLMSLVLERFGMISQIQAVDFASGNNIISGADIAKEFAAIAPRYAAFLPWSYTHAERPDDGFPDQETVVVNEAGAKEEGARSITLEKKEG